MEWKYEWTGARLVSYASVREGGPTKGEPLAASRGQFVINWVGT